MLEPVDFQRLKALIATPEPPELGPGPRTGVEPQATLNEKLRLVLSAATSPAANQDLIRATVLLWHDHLELAHTIAQQMESADGSYVHGIMHRREPDYGNAKYWFRRVGEHPCLAELAVRARALLPNDTRLESKLISRGGWDPFAFIDACEEAARRSATGPQGQLLRAIQGIEFELLLERFWRDQAR